MSNLMTLLDKYKTMKKIPEEELTEIGMVRLVREDGAVEVLPRSRLEERVAKEGKIAEKAIFGVLGAKIPLKEISFNYISQDRVNRFSKLANHIGNEFVNVELERSIDQRLEFFGEATKGLLDFKRDLSRFLENKLGFTEFEATTIINGPFDQLGNYRPFGRIVHDNSLANDFRYIKGLSALIEKTQYEKAFTKLENIRTKLLDFPLFKYNFDGHLNGNPEDHDWGQQLETMGGGEVWVEVPPNNNNGNGSSISYETIEIPSSEASLRILNENLTLTQVILETFPEYLIDKGLPGVAEGARDCESIDQLRDYLGKVRKSDLPAFTREKELKKEIKGKSRREARIISKLLKVARKDVKEQLTLVNAANDFISMYEVFGRNTANYIRKMQECIVNTSAADSALVYLDGRANFKEDKDPGKLVRDCTEGRPLPFYMPTVHNIKVRYSQDGESVGSVYLFETSLADDEGKKVWHLDAIQIPKTGDWEKGIEAILESISPEAKKAGVDYITVNDKDNLISNFDYVARGVIRFHNRTSLGRTRVNLEPFATNDDDYSRPQGTNEQRILWENE